MFDEKISELLKDPPPAYSKEHIERLSQHDILLSNIKNALPELKELMTRATSEGSYEDAFYRYYHGSFKTYYIQGLTVDIVNKLKSISPNDEELNSNFMKIITDGTNKVWEHSHNQEWEKHCRPMLEAFSHARYFLDMAIRYGETLEAAPCCLPFGWAALLYLYNIR